jgi:hypothetical protein
MTTAPATKTEIPKPNPFAVMRNVHEALRTGIARQRTLLDAGDLGALSLEWSDFSRSLAVHMAMEDKGTFPLLEEVVPGAVTGAKLFAEHLEDTRLATRVHAALTAVPVDPGAVSAAWSAWQEDHLDHLDHEEKVMMPLIPKAAATPEGRARVVRDRILACVEERPDFDWFVGWVIRMLVGHVSEAFATNAALRGFVAGLQLACSPAQWERLRPAFEENCPRGCGPWRTSDRAVNDRWGFVSPVPGTRLV